MKKSILFIAGLLLALPAHADTPAEKPVEAAQTGDLSIVKPQPLGSPHRCVTLSNSWLGSTPHGARAQVHVKFQIAADGTAKDAVADSSSGDTDLDALTVRCVEHWRYKPATKDGQPINFPWETTVRYWHS